MPKLTLTDITSGYASVTQLNDNFAAIETAIENTVSRDGTTPNTMSADLDMNGNTILNLADIEINGTSIAQLATDADDAALSAASAYVSEVNAAASEAAAIAAAAVVVDWEYSGTWTTATPYVKNNIVYNSTTGDSYICLVDHFSGVFATDVGNSFWGLLALHATVAGVGDMLKSENLSGLANYATARNNMGLTIGQHVEAHDDTLTALAGLNATAGLVEQTAADAFTKRPISTDIKAFLDAADKAAARTALGVSALTALDAYPVGAVYISVVSTSPATLFGGTWAAFGAGRVLVGIDAGQTEFDTVEETGGAKTHTLTTAEMPSHTHRQSWDVSTSGTGAYIPAGLSYEGDVDGAGALTVATGGGGAHNNLQPYIVCYFWKRTA